MKINISVQRKTNIESNRTPNQKTKKQQTQNSAGGRTARTGGRTGGHGCGGRTGGCGGRTGQEQRRRTVLKTAR